MKSEHVIIEPGLSYSGIKAAVLAAGSSLGELGGAERFYLGLTEGLREIGCHVKLIFLPADESSFEQIVDNYESCHTLDLSAYDVVISTKAPTYAVNHPCHIMYLVHTVRVFDDMFYETFPDATLRDFSQRAKIHSFDTKALAGIKVKFAIGHEVASRLFRWRGVMPEVMHPPIGFSGFRCEKQGDYLFLPGRLHPWKRADLVIDAIKRSKKSLKLIISGIGEAESDLKRLASGDPRIEFIGRVSDEKLIDLYANALAVPFVPKREDYGYITLEAFASSKPVVTCSDSGEPIHFVRHNSNGLICEPSSESLCEAFEWLFEHRDEAKKMGQKGKELISGMAWSSVATRLLQAALDTAVEKKMSTTRVAVFDMQPITPAVGGGRQRLLGLYHNLGNGIDCHYVGTYDWVGESFRRQQLSNGLEEITVPLSEEHHIASQQISSQSGGKTVIDITFGQLGYLSKNYIEAAKNEIQKADVVVFSHPWVFPLLATYLKPEQVIVYESHNVEGYLRAQFLDESNPVEKKLLRQVAQDEYDLICRADLVLACSQEDMARFNRVYDISYNKMRIAPNGVMAFAAAVPGEKEKKVARKNLKLDDNGLIAIFIGSPYGPNLDAAQFIVEELALAIPEVTFIIAGGVGGHVTPESNNVVITGGINEHEKYLWFCAADVAINPMFSGSGTNIKMFDFMALELPILTTATGARGIETGDQPAMLICEPNVESFVSAMNQLQDVTLRNSIGKEARLCVEEGYSWERISPITGAMLKQRHQFSGQPKPLFSVVIPTYERHEQLESLVKCLQSQIERDFEVIIVDQSVNPWIGAEQNYGFPVLYYHSPVKGAVRARNTGVTLAQGEIIAFTDDDCLPTDAWLINARQYFLSESTVGVEGIIFSDHLGEPEWRQVTNVGLEGIGFMTANLMVRSCVFQQLGGFDLQFDKPHFREDTDFGWRMLGLGNVPYAKDVSVFHPAQPRSLSRESASERARFFVKDALLYKKHPDRYQALFLVEQHFKNTPGFIEHLQRGFGFYKITPPDWMDRYLEK